MDHNDDPSLLIGTTETVLDTMAQHIHQHESGSTAHHAIATQLWSHLKALEYTSGQLLVAGADAELFAGAPPGTLRVTEGLNVEGIGNVEGKVLLAADLPSAAQWPHHGLDIRPADRDDLNGADVAITNLPFCDVRTLTRDNQIDIAFLHHSFIQEALTWLRPGGLMVALAHRQLLDGPDAQPRRSIARQADLIAAARLPASALRQAPLQDSPVDLLMLRRREPGHPPSGLEFIDRGLVHVHDVPDMPINDCYAAHPWAVLGNIVPDPIQPGLTSVAPIGGDFSDDLDAVLHGHIDDAIEFRLHAQERPTRTKDPRPPSPGERSRTQGSDPETPAL